MCFQNNKISYFCTYLETNETTYWLIKTVAPLGLFVIFAISISP